MTHEDLVKNLVKDGAIIADEMTSESAHLMHMALGVAGEAGELVDAIKKYVIYNKELDIENLIEEIGDMYFYLQGILNELNVSKEAVLQHNIDKLTVRYGNQYSDKAAHDRKDKMV